MAAQTQATQPKDQYFFTRLDPRLYDVTKIRDLGALSDVMVEFIEWIRTKPASTHAGLEAMKAFIGYLLIDEIWDVVECLIPELQLPQDYVIPDNEHTAMKTVLLKSRAKRPVPGFDWEKRLPDWEHNIMMDTCRAQVEFSYRKARPDEKERVVEQWQQANTKPIMSVPSAPSLPLTIRTPHTPSAITSAASMPAASIGAATSAGVPTPISPPQHTTADASAITGSANSSGMVTQGSDSRGAFGTRGNATRGRAVGRGATRGPATAQAQAFRGYFQGGGPSGGASGPHGT